MAKGKHSTALFEVIHAGKSFDDRRAAGSALLTPKWWFKGRLARDVEPSEAEPAAAPEPKAKAARLAVSDMVAREGLREPAAQPEETPESAASTAAARPVEPVPVDVYFSAEPATPVLPALGRRSGMHFAFDRDRQEVTLRVRYTTAIVAGFALMVAVGLAYVTGRSSVATPAVKHGSTAMTTQQVKDGPKLPGVLDVKPQPPPANNPGRPVGAVADAGDDFPVLDTEEAPKAAPPARSGPVHALRPADRIIGLNYVIVQTYPNQESAAEACAVLNRSGVACSVERGPKGWAKNPNWYSVVGLVGFQRMRGVPEYENHVRQIESVGEDYAARFKGSGKFKRFQPSPFLWREI